MKNTIIFLMCLVITNSLFANNQAHLSSEFKKGDYFFIEFADKFEDYSPVPANFDPFKASSQET